MAYRGGLPGQSHSDYYSSHTYMWSSKDKLGQGATGQVFVGYNKVASGTVSLLIKPCLSIYTYIH